MNQAFELSNFSAYSLLKKYCAKLLVGFLINSKLRGHYGPDSETLTLNRTLLQANGATGVNETTHGVRIIQGE